MSSKLTNIPIDDGHGSEEDEELTTKTILKKTGVVFEGEAPESDEEDNVVAEGIQLEDDLSLRSHDLNARLKFNGSRSSSNSSLSSAVKSSSSGLLRSLFSVSLIRGEGLSEGSNRQPLTKYPGLLHRKLFDKNLMLRKQLVNLSLYPYNKSAKDMQSLTQDMIKTQKILSETSAHLDQLKEIIVRSNINVDQILESDFIRDISVEETVVD